MTPCLWGRYYLSYFGSIHNRGWLPERTKSFVLIHWYFFKTSSRMYYAGVQQPNGDILQQEFLDIYPSANTTILMFRCFIGRCASIPRFPWKKVTFLLPVKLGNAFGRRVSHFQNHKWLSWLLVGLVSVDCWMPTKTRHVLYLYLHWSCRRNLISVVDRVRRKNVSSGQDASFHSWQIIVQSQKFHVWTRNT